MSIDGYILSFWFSGNTGISKDSLLEQVVDSLFTYML
jgi:hypothetical protein